MGRLNQKSIVFVLTTLFLVFVLSQLKNTKKLIFFDKTTLAQKALPVQQELGEGKSFRFEERPWPINYVVFGSSTPNGESYRSYDYAFDLPLTVLAWERIGFRSIVLIVGSRCEWENDPALSYILSHLETSRANIIFIAGAPEQRSKLSQTARVFAANLPEFPGKDNDYLITSDSDLWPLRKEHYMPRPNMDIVLLHSTCCGHFKMNNESYPMYPMSNIGAAVSIWQQVMNDNHSVAFNAETIMNYLKDVFGEMSRGPSIVGEDTWYMDQWITSIRLTEWMKKHGDKSVYHVSDVGFNRLDRSYWDAATMSQENFLLKFDAHLPLKIYLPENWNNSIKPLINLMYGKNSWQVKWCNEYAIGFLHKVKNYLNFASLMPVT